MRNSDFAVLCGFETGVSGLVGGLSARFTGLGVQLWMWFRVCLALGACGVFVWGVVHKPSINELDCSASTVSPWVGIMSGATQLTRM